MGPAGPLEYSKLHAASEFLIPMGPAGPCKWRVRPYPKGPYGAAKAALSAPKGVSLSKILA